MENISHLGPDCVNFIHCFVCYIQSFGTTVLWWYPATCLKPALIDLVTKVGLGWCFMAGNSGTFQTRA